jgi:glycosyltransferase involved in cell wall biosynthesis
LAEKINLLFKDKELSKELGENGYRRLMDNFTYTHFKNNLKNVLIEKNND